MTTMPQTIPSKVIRWNYNLHYLTNDFMSAIWRKLKLYKDARHLNTNCAWSKYHKLRNRVTSALRKAKTNYYKVLSLKLSSPKDFWTAYYRLIPKKPWIAADLKYNDVSVSTSLEKANFLNKFFSSCFTPSSEFSIPDSPPKSSPGLTILKQGDPSSVLNYQPISLPPLLSKLLERIVHNNISNFLYSNKLPSNCQFGFRPRSSTQEALFSVTNCWYQLLCSHRQVAAIFYWC